MWQNPRPKCKLIPQLRNQKSISYPFEANLLKNAKDQNGNLQKSDDKKPGFVRKMLILQLMIFRGTSIN